MSCNESCINKFTCGYRHPIELPPCASEKEVATPSASDNTQSDEIAALKERVRELETAFHDFVMLHEPVSGFDSCRI